MAEDPIVLLKHQADDVLASLVGSTSSKTRTALETILPKGSTQALTASVAQIIRQRPDGTWPNYIRDANTGGRIYTSTVAGGRPPAYADGLAAGDLYITQSLFQIATNVPSAGSVSWVTVATGGGGGVTTPTTPTPTGDTSTPSTSVIPYAPVGMSGTWTAPSGMTLAQALSDNTTSSVTATPSAGEAGVSLTLDMTSFAHSAGNDITLVLDGVSSAQAGDMTVSIGYQGVDYAIAKTAAVTSTPQTVRVTWPKADQLSLTAEQWRQVEVKIARASGGFTALSKVSLQSSTPQVPVTPGIDPLQPASVIWAPGSVLYSDLTAAPLARANAAIAAFVRGQVGSGSIRLDCFSDAPQVWMANASTPRVNITPPASSSRGDVALMHNASGTGAMDGVPIPENAAPPTNVFKTAVVAQVDTKQVWEFIGLTKDATTGKWSASWGGRVDNIGSNVGQMPASQGFTGSGIPFLGPAIKVSEAQDAAAGNTKAIPHAIGINLNYDTAQPTWAWPATRSDGSSTNPGAPKMGQRLRLNAQADLSSCTPIGRAVGEAMKRYGAIVMGGSDKPSILCESGAVEQIRTGVDPWASVLGGKTVDTVLAGLPLNQLEAVSPGWGDPKWVAESDSATTNPVTPTPTPTTPTGQRTYIYIPAGGWLSGASCRAIEDSSEGMGSPWAQWRGEPAYMARTWWDQDAKPDWTLGMRWKNWHASIDGAPGLMFKGEDIWKAASGDPDMWKRLKADISYCRQWYLSRKDPKKVNFFLSPAHEMNGDWYRWSLNPNIKTAFQDFWKRYREAQLQLFPEALLTWNANYDTKSSVGMDWRRYIPDYESKGAAGVKQWIDVGSVDYYNAWSVWANTVDGWNQIAYNKVDQWGAPIGIDKHRQFWEACGLPMTVPEWGGHATRYGDAPQATVAINDYFRKWKGGGPGRVLAEAYFNLTSGYDSGDSPGKFALYGDTVAMPQTAAKYRELTWGV